jgi:hypothetical protein
MHWSLPCSSVRLRSSQLGACGPPRTYCSTYSSFEKAPPTTGPTCDGYAHITSLIKIYTRTKGNRAKTNATILFDIFVDRSQNYESNGTGFIIFWSPEQRDMNFQSLNMNLRRKE